MPKDIFRLIIYTSMKEIIMAHLPPFYLECTVAIGVKVSDVTHWIATGFIVGRPFEYLKDDGTIGKKYHTFLVTNNHVVKDKSDIILRFNIVGGYVARDFLLPLNEVLMKSHSTGDITVISIDSKLLRECCVDLQCFKLDEDVLTIRQMQTEGVSEGDNIFVLGFPLGLVEGYTKNAIVRGGVIARIQDIFKGVNKSFLIDTNNFPGNSGGPVILRPEIFTLNETKAINQAYLIGVVKEYFFYKNDAVSQSTGEPLGYFKENSGLAVVESIDIVKETIEDCFTTFRNEFS